MLCGEYVGSVCVRREDSGKLGVGGHECLKETQKVLRRLLVGTKKNAHSHS